LGGSRDSRSRPSTSKASSASVARHAGSVTCFVCGSTLKDDDERDRVTDMICGRWMSRSFICWVLAMAACSSGGGPPHSPVADGATPGAEPDAKATDADEPQADGAAESADAGTAANVSFALEVMPIFKRSCAVGSAMCHGDPSVATNGQGTGGNRAYLGPPYSAGDPATILAGLVGQPSFEDPAMNVVTAGSPTTSYLMLKMDGALAPLAAACASGGLGKCGASMPMGGQLLPPETRDTVRNWIAQGALNN
jgi:hypothetical protein